MIDGENENTRERQHFSSLVLFYNIVSYRVDLGLIWVNIVQYKPITSKNSTLIINLQQITLFIYKICHK